MKTVSLLGQLEEAKNYIQGLYSPPVQIGMILGSGLGDLADEVQNKVVIPYGAIPHFPTSTVEGHAGRMVLGVLDGKHVVCLQGRVHYYENYDMGRLAFPVQVMKMMGIENLLVTNACGCVNTSWNPGDLMIISDHIKLVQDNPLRGENIDALGPRFFDMTTAYDKNLRALAKKCADELDIPIREGVYQWFSGPSFETPAEVKLARLLGADAVGMSTVPEVIAAAHMRMHTLGLSCLTNMAAGILDQPLNHTEVLHVAQQVKSQLSSLVKEIVRNWLLE